MKVLYRVGRYTTANRPAIRHIDDTYGSPLCGKDLYISSWEHDDDEPTCARCKKMDERTMTELVY